MGMNEFMIYDLRFTIYALKAGLNERLEPGSKFRLPAAASPKTYPGGMPNACDAASNRVNRKS
jgi:hypothetical protein